MNEQKRNECLCPYCDEEITRQRFPFCQPCQVTLLYCKTCEIAVEPGAEVCPWCGDELERR